MRQRFKIQGQGRVTLLRSTLFGVILLTGCEETTVQTIQVVSLSLDPSQVVVVEGDEVEVRAAPRGPGGELLGGREVRWSTMDPSIARFLEPGRLLGVTPGTTRVRAEVEGLVAEGEVTVLEAPRLGVSPPEFAFSGVAGSEEILTGQLQVENLGQGELSGISVEALDFDPPDTSNWLSWDLDGPIAPTRVVVAVAPGPLLPGGYSAELEVSSANGRDGPVRVPILLTVAEPPPVIGLSPSSIALSAGAGSIEPASQNVRVRNEGGGVLAGLQLDVQHAAGEPTGWLSVALDSPTAPAILTVEATARGLPPRGYRATVVVFSPGAEPESAELAVSFQVSGARELGGSTDPARLPGEAVHPGVAPR